MRRSWIAGAALIASVCGAAAQDFVVIDGEGIVFSQELTGEQPEPAADGASSAAKPSKRLAKLKALEFDRRPSAILAEWAKPPAPPEPEAEPPPADAAASEGEAAPDPTAQLTPEDGEPLVEPAEGASGGAAAEADPAAGAEAGAEAEAADAEAEKDVAARAAAEKAAAAQREAAEKKRLEEEEKKRIDREMVALQRSVTLGDWDAVRAYFSGLTEDEQKGGYERLLQSLQSGPSKKPNVPQQGRAYLEKNRFSPADVQGLARVPSVALRKEDLALLGQILRQALDAGHQLETYLALVRPRLDEEGFAPDRRQLARILVGAGCERALEGLLPDDELAREQGDREGLNLLARYYLARHAEEPKTVWLEHAWHVTQAALSAGEIEEAEKTEAIQRAVDIAPKIQAELGMRWLEESFTERPERGMEILAAIGKSASQALSMQPTDDALRLRLLELQTTAADALIASAPERAGQWRAELDLLAGNWLSEALLSYQMDDSTSLGPRVQRDVYGNVFYYDMGWTGNRGMAPTPIRTAQVLEHRPSEAWLALVEDTLRPRLSMAYAQLYLKVGEEAEAFPYIEALAASEPRAAQSLVSEFLRVWAKNHNPNEQRQRANPYVYFYGFEERANGIPLTRSKQERNLAELGQWVRRLRGLPVEVDEDEVAAAFQAAHSSAEVYRLETIETIFGPLSGLEPATLAALLGKMRANLADVWRDPALQEKSKTNRHPKDIESEVKRGYALARETVARALAEHPESWELALAQAALEHDENGYLYELAKDPEFSARRQAAFASFHHAAELYARAVETLEKDEESTEVFETWFYAALGACDLKAVSHEMQLAAGEIPLVRAALEALPGACRDRHRDRFASSLFTRMSNAAPAVKFRYVREGLAIAGDNELVREARDVFDYYNDLVTEIQLVARIDGGDRVGHGAPFGLSVLLRHTKEIERESGGFAKYLQNQNNQSFGYNYGRPLEDYRDKFEEAARETLAEHFDVLSVTFEEPTVTSRAAEPYGWRETPYAYLLLRPRGPEVDRLPPLRLDLDFLDSTGYAVLPIETAALPIDARDERGEERPYADLALTQTLDERQAKDGKLLLEVKATAQGLPPSLDALLELDPGEFEIAASEDHGVSVVKFHESGESIEAERTWTIELRARQDLAAPPSTFAFGRPRVETRTSELFRFVDADLASAEAVVSLERRYGRPDRSWMWQVPLGLLVLAGALFGFRRLQRPRAQAPARFQVPEPLTPFTVLGLLRDIHTNNGLSGDRRGELEREIAVLERHFFVEREPAGSEPVTGRAREVPDLLRIAEDWVSRAR